MAYDETPTKETTMLKIKTALAKIKADIKENPATYAVALAAGATTGILAAIYLSKKEDSGDIPHLYLSEPTANWMRDSNTGWLFDTPAGEFSLMYVNPE
jgi:hypothetical protein